MGSEISSFVVEPLLGVGICVLAVFAIIKQNSGNTTAAKWFAIGAVALTIILIVLNIVLSMYG